MSATCTTVLEEIASERKRQLSQEGYSSSHDDEHASGQIAKAAAIYADPSPRMYSDPRIIAPIGWPSDWEWKPKDQRRNLIRAASLIIAEIERLDRKTI